MSGHSKWSQIKRQKGAADVKKGSLFTKLGNNITIASREGGGNPETNFKLRLTIEKAKEANMPKDNVDRAIKRGTGELLGAKLEEVIYEAFGPEGVAIIIESVTANRNKTASELRSILAKNGGNLGETNSVMWLFDRKGVIYVKSESLSLKREELELELIDQGADDFKEEDEVLIIYTKPDHLETVKKALEKRSVSTENAELEFVPKNMIKADSLKNPEKIKKLLEELENCEEVSNFFSNYEG